MVDPSTTMIGQTMSWRRIGIICAVLIGIFLLSFVATCVVLHMLKTKVPKVQTGRLVGSVRVEELFGKKLTWNENLQNISTHSKLKGSLERVLLHCLDSMKPQSLEVTSVGEDSLTRIFGVNDRGAIVEWSAELPQDETQSYDAVKETLMSCRNDIELEPESVKVGLESMRSTRSYESLENFLLENEEEFDLRNIQLPSISTPKFSKENFSCSPLSVPHLGSIQPISCTLPDHITVGMTCKFFCSPNQTLIGISDITCLATGSWKFLTPVCSNFCPKLSFVPNGGVYPASCTGSEVARPGTRCFYFCDRNYVLEGSSLTCSSTGVWKGAIPLCKKTCSPLSAPTDGSVSPTLCAKQRISVGFVCSFDCDKGFTVSGPASLRCDVNGRWSSPLPICRKGCPLLRSPTHGSISPISCTAGKEGREEVMEGIVCIYSCSDGYVLHGVEERMCSEGGIWTSEQPGCKRVCRPIPLVPNMIAFPHSCQSGNVTEGTKCDLHCTGHYAMFGATTFRLCLEIGIWSASDASCYRTCTPLPGVHNGVIHPSYCIKEKSIIPDGTECTLECSDGFFLSGAGEVYCSDSGIWSGFFGQCLKKCEKLTAPQSGYILPFSCTLYAVFQGQHCEFTCEEEHTLEGLRVLTCLGDGTWAGSLPRCKPDSHLIIRQKTADRDVCLTANLLTMEVQKQSFDKCYSARGLHWWISTSSGQLRSVGVEKCMSSNPTSGSVIKLEDCDENPNQKWVWRAEDHAQSIALRDKNLFVYFGFASAPAVSLSDQIDEKALWYVVFSNKSLSFFEEEFGGSCPKLRNSSTVVNPPECVLDIYVKNNVTCHFSCLSDFKLYGFSNRTCLNGQWNNAYSTCRKACNPLTNPLKGEVTSNYCKHGLQDQGTICRYECQPHHTLIGENEVMCLSHGEWSFPKPSCIEICPMLPTVSHGRIEPTSCLVRSSLFGRNCTLNCEFPYVVQGSPTVTCLANHAWSGNWSCARGCETPQLKNGETLCENNPVYEQTKCVYTCNSPHVFVNFYPPFDVSLVRMCQPDGLFNGSSPVCGMVCKALKHPDDGKIVPNNCTTGLVIEGVTCRVECNTGYRFRGRDRHIICSPDGEWSDKDYKCEEEVQFTLFNDEGNPEVCGRINDYELGALMIKLNYAHHKCFYLYVGSLWTWVGDMIKHVRSGLCLAVQDSSTQSFSLIVLLNCDEEDSSQLWDCEHEYLLKMISKPLYMSASSKDHYFMIVKDVKTSSTMSDFTWKSIPTKNRTNVGGACNTKLKRCPTFQDLPNGEIVPADCKTRTQYEGSVCNITCDSGYLLHRILQQSFSVNCLYYGAWRSSIPHAVDAFPPKCMKSCPPLNAPINGAIAPQEICTGNRSAYGTACRFSCDFPFELDGPDVIVCGIDGSWSESLPECKAKCIHGKINPDDHLDFPYKEYPAISVCADTINIPRVVDEGSTCFYHCPGGFHKLVGSISRTCLQTRDFDLRLPYCVFPHASSSDLKLGENSLFAKLSSCPHPPGEPQSIYSCFLVISDPFTERICANYTCDPGYKLIGESRAHCDITSYTWPDPPSCKRLCEDIPYRCTDVYAGQICYYECRFGESFSHGNGILLCQENGKWNDTIPSCIEVPDFFIKTSIATRLGQYCLIPPPYHAPFGNEPVTIEECFGQTRSRWMWKYNFNIMHSISALCLTASDTKHGARLSLSFCDPLNPMQHWDCSTDLENPLTIAFHSDPSLVLGTMQTLINYDQYYYFTCLVDLSVLDNENLKSTKWETEVFYKRGSVCAMRQNEANCPPLLSAVPGGVTLSPSTCLEEWSPQGRSCYWFCDANVLRNSSAEAVVKCDHGVWDSQSFHCKRSCPPLGNPVNGILTDCDPMSKGGEGKTCNMECVENGYPMSETTRVCQWDGTWSGAKFKCAKSCPALTINPDLIIEPTKCMSGDRPIAGTICSYSCVEGYYMTSKETIRTCLDGGVWSGKEPHCVRVCSPLPEIPHSSISPAMCASPPLQAGILCTVSCDLGYQIIGNETHECEEDGTWSNFPEGSKAVCQPQCASFVHPQNSRTTCSLHGEDLSLSLAYYTEDSECLILCDIGYAIQGSWIRRCDGNGTWSGDDGYCYPEEQLFFIFLSKESDGNGDVKICLAASPADVVVKINAAYCDSHSPLHRWMWYSGLLLRNSGTGKCMSVSEPYAGQQLELAECNHNNSLQQWSCNSDEAEWFLRSRQHDLYPDFGFSTVQALWVYDLNLYDKKENIMWYSLLASENYYGPNDKSLRSTICSMRGEDTGGICSPLTLPENGKIYPSICAAQYHKINAGLTCLYECNIGFKSDISAMTVVCQKNGVWSGPPPKCKGFCSPFNLMPHMVIHPSSCYINDDHDMAEEEGILPGGICSISCEDGYTFEDAKQITITCLENGQWSSKPSECQSICPIMSRVQYAVATPESCFREEQIQGTICALECDDGYAMDVTEKSCPEILPSNKTDYNATGALQNCTEDEKPTVFIQKLTKLCMGDGTWSGDRVKCVALCQPTVSPWNGQILPSLCTENLVKDGTVCKYTCDDGFMVIGDDTRVCRQGSWVIKSALIHNDGESNKNILFASDEPPACERFCLCSAQNDTFTFVTPAVCSQEKIPVGVTCMTSCHSDFILIGNSKTMCLSDGSWDGTPAKCIKKCAALLPIDNGAVFPQACTTTSLGSGAICTFACLNQYALVGNVAITCNSTGSWSSLPPECKKRCDPLVRIYNGIATPALSCYGEHITVGDFCQFACNDGFALEGTEVMGCQSDGQWNASIPKCVRLCPVPAVDNGTIVCTEANYMWGTTCKIICDKGLAPSSVALVTCNNRGDWSPVMPDCVETGVPMYIMQSLDGNNICLMENKEGKILRVSKQECLMSPSDSIRAYQWRWLENFNIQNAASGRCIAVHYVQTDEPVITAPCDTEDSLQWWECSTNNPFRLLLRDTAFSPSTYIKNSNNVVLQLWSDAHSYFSTLSLNTVTFSSLCSRRPGGACPPLRDIAGGVVEPPEECRTSAVEGQLCGYQCLNDNMVLIGEPVTQCLGNGVWLNPPPKCVGSCPMLDETLPPHTYYEDPDCVFDEPQTDQVCTASCLEGYEMRGNPSRTCLANGNWSPRLFDCQKICPVIFGILDGKVNPLPCRSVTCMFSCNPGYVLNGVQAVNCREDGEWDNSIPQCQRDAQFQIISLGVQSSTMCVTVDKSVPATLRKCTVGNALQLFKWIQNSNLLKHTATGLCLTGNLTKWAEVKLDFCNESNSLQSWECGISPGSEVQSLHILQEGHVQYLDVGAGNEHNKIVMENSYYSSSQWLAKHYFSKGTVCSMRDFGQCPPFTAPNHGDVSPKKCSDHAEIHEGVVCTVSCDSGFKLQATPHATCQPDGKWSLPMPVCKGVDMCEKIVSASVEVSPNSCKGLVNSGETCHFSCKDGFVLIGNRFAKCLDNGIWSGSPPTCVQVCSALPLPGYGTVNPIWCLGHNNPVDTRCVSSCIAGFRMVGQPTRICRGNGLWSGDNVQCIRTCSPLFPPTHGMIFPTQCINEQNNDGTECQFQCEAGYGLKGAKDLVCFDGKWSAVLPTCVLLNACPSIVFSQDCQMSLLYDGLYHDKFIVPGTKVTLSCGSSCKIPNGPTTRTCNETGLWNHGTPTCKKMCPPVKVSFGAILRPVSCSYSWQVHGVKCKSTCAKRMVARGVTEIGCGDNGLWSNQLGACEKLRKDTHIFSKPFMIRQFYSGERLVCLQANAKNAYVFQASYELCSEINLSQLWTWYNHRSIRSVSSGLCWTPVRKEGGIILGLQQCSLEDSGQVFMCGNIASQGNKLHVVTEGMHVWNSGSTVIQLTSVAVDQGLDWESRVIGEKSTNVLKTNNTMSLQSPICRALCGDSTTSHSGTFITPGYPSSYERNLVCDWEIKTPNRRIYLWLHDVDIGSPKSNEDGQCNGDHVIILDGESTSLEDSNILGRICGKWKSNLGPFIGLHEKMTVKFISDDAGTTRGFAATWDTEPMPPAVSECGIGPSHEVSGRLVGGVETNTSKVPWHASLLSLQGQQHSCSATFTHSQYLITAAHCLSGLNQDSVSDYIIGYGAPYQRLLLNLIQDLISSDDGQFKKTVNSSDGATLVTIDKFHVHPEFGDTLDNDIALIRITVASHFGSSVACLPPQYKESELYNFGRVESVKEYCTVAGWDSEKQGGVIGLHSISLPVVSDHYCDEISAKSFGRQVDTKSVLCAAHFDGTKQSLCDGDDGSALVCEWNGNYYVVGVASFQLSHCGKLNVPKYFARVSTYREWIMEKMIEDID